MIDGELREAKPDRALLFLLGSTGLRFGPFVFHRISLRPLPRRRLPGTSDSLFSAGSSGDIARVPLAIEQLIHHRNEDQRQHGGERHTADDSNRHWRADLGAFAPSERHRNETRARC